MEEGSVPSVVPGMPDLEQPVAQDLVVTNETSITMTEGSVISTVSSPVVSELDNQRATHDKYKHSIDHRPRATYLNCRVIDDDHPPPVKGSKEALQPYMQEYLGIVTKIRVPSTHRVYEGWEKKKGRLVYFKRNVFVPPYDYIDVLLYDHTSKPPGLIHGKILFTEHNVERKKQTKDDTWDESTFLNNVQDALQYQLDSNQYFKLTLKYPPVDEDEREDDESEFVTLDVRCMRGGITLVYIVPLELKPFNDIDFSDFMTRVKILNFDVFANFCRAGKLKLAKDIVFRGHIDVASSYVEGGWTALHMAANSGRILICQWLVDELGLDYNAVTAKEGYTPLHCACLKGQFEVAKYLVTKGCSLTQFSKGGQKNGAETPLTLMFKGRYANMLRYFLGEDSEYTKKLYQGYGTRYATTKDIWIKDSMFSLIRPFHTSKKSSKMLKAILKRCEEVNA